MVYRKWEILGKDKNKSKQTRIALLKEYFKSFENIDFVEIDVTDKTSIQLAVKYVKNKYGKLDILINNAGMVWFPRYEFNYKGIIILNLY